jgi:ferredoxin
LPSGVIRGFSISYRFARLASRDFESTLAFGESGPGIAAGGVGSATLNLGTPRGYRSHPGSNASLGVETDPGIYVLAGEIESALTPSDAVLSLPFKEPKEDSMRVRINKQCMGDRNCNKLCPEVFEYDEDQLLAIVKFDVIPEQYHERVRRAARECVPQAIEIEE